MHGQSNVLRDSCSCEEPLNSWMNHSCHRLSCNAVAADEDGAPGQLYAA